MGGNESVQVKEGAERQWMHKVSHGTEGRVRVDGEKS